LPPPRTMTRPMPHSSPSPSPSTSRTSAVAPDKNVRLDANRGPLLLGTPEQLAVRNQSDVKYAFPVELTRA
jgi:hypothetical protein